MRVTIYPHKINEAGEPVSGITTLTKEQELENIKNKNVVYLDDEEYIDYINWRNSRRK